MAVIAPFAGWRFNPQVSNLARLICPPYDIISARQQEELYASYPYNMVRLEYAQPLPRDNVNDNHYSRAKTTYSLWK
ncbi:MAG: DUF1015 family protein, partial [Clostridia bacterium]|nr:DUF1015 family protein [Clostridia bacterium]